MTVNSLLTTMLLLAAGAVAGPSPNFVPNAGFEREGTPGYKLWPGSTSATFVRDANVRKSGTASGRLVLPKAEEAATIYTYVPLKENTDYTLSFWWKTADWKRAGSSSATVSFSFCKEDGGNGSAGVLRTPFPATGETGGDWTKFSFDFKTPAETVRCQLLVVSARGITGTVWLDDISVREIAHALPVAKLAQPPVIDGQLSDACWQAAVPLTKFYHVNREAKRAKDLTTAWLAYDDTALYIAFRNQDTMQHLKADVTERDGALWTNDCNEIFIQAPNGQARQFIINALAAQWDGRIFQRVPGDPWRADGKWNGQWQTAASKGTDHWIVEIAIPWSNFSSSPRETWRVNLARERHGAAKELLHWNQFEGKFSNVDKFGYLAFRDGTALLTRFREPPMKNPLAIARKTERFKELLTDHPGGYIVGSWAAERSLSSYPKNVQDSYTPESFRLEQAQMWKECGEAGMFGPALPWIFPKDISLGGMKRLNQQYGMTFPLYCASSWHSRMAAEAGAKFKLKARVNGVDPAHAKVMHEYLERVLKEYTAKGVIPYIALLNGEDEPANTNLGAFSLTANTEARQELLALDAEIKRTHGFGTYGLFDGFAADGSERTSPFHHIAFWSWWSQRYADVRQVDREIGRKYAPNAPYLINYNTVSGATHADFTIISTATDYVSCDPYPTSTLASYGRDRALYHPGFSTKLIHDTAVPGVEMCVMPQMFIYHGRGPTVDNTREWASQSLKTGATMFYWYNSGTPPSRVALPEAHKEMLRINRVTSTMNKLKLPAKTATAIYFDQRAKWGAFDNSLYSWYTLYTLLGERLHTWFRFVSDGNIRLGNDRFENYELVYVPELKYTSRAIAEKLVSYVKQGGVLVLTDPETCRWNIDGSPLLDVRKQLLGGSLGNPREATSLTVTDSFMGVKKGAELPLTPVRARKGAGKLLAFDIAVPADAHIFASYADGKPAAYSRAVGAGQVIYFAAQPFGNARLAIQESPWIGFLAALAEKVAEPKVEIWDFMFPKTGGEVDVKYIGYEPE
ncbi:MAG: hypothetical protein HN904_19900 [Victivallales bacterium]|nr:hypothetical protein [Victivallales bacterium]